MTALLNLALVVALGVTAGAFMSYAIAKGRPVAKGIFGLGRGDERALGIQEDDSPPAWKLPRS